MTPAERAAKLGCEFETSGDDAHVEVWRGDIADAIQAAAGVERERCAKVVEDEADEREKWLGVCDPEVEGECEREVYVLREVAKLIREGT